MYHRTYNLNLHVQCFLYNLFKNSVACETMQWIILCYSLNDSVMQWFEPTYIRVHVELVITMSITQNEKKNKIIRIPVHFLTYKTKQSKLFHFHLQGNVVLWKPSPSAIYASYLVFNIFRKAGINQTFDIVTPIERDKWSDMISYIWAEQQTLPL